MRETDEPTPIKEALEQTISRLGLKKGLQENGAVACWEEVVGEKIAAKSHPLKITAGVLYIKTSSPAWSQQLSLMAEELKQKINDYLGQPTVKQIRFRS